MPNGTIGDHDESRDRDKAAILTKGQRAIIRHMEDSDGRVVAYKELADLLKSTSRSPKGVIKVHMHAIRKVLGSRSGISSVRGVGLIRTPKADGPDADSVLSVDASRRVLLDGKEMRLTKQTSMTLRTIIEHGESATTIQQIADDMRSKASQPANLVKVLLSKARKEAARMGKTLPVRTIRGIGFVLTGPEDPTRRT